MKSVIDKINENYGEADRQLLIKAYRYAEKMHENQKRASGEPYFTHPCAVAEILVDLGLDTPTVAAAFLHDVIEDTDATPDDIKREFGTEIYTLVDGVTKLDRIKFHSHEEEDAENFRKIFVAMAKDVRVIIIKLADRLHNMRSLNYLSNERQQRIAKETLGIFTPLADRLGISQVKCELEDLCLKYLEPEAYEYLVTNINQKREERQMFVDTVVAQLRKMLDENGIKGEVVGRPKHFYSIYKKMKNKGLTLDQIYDLTAVRVIVDEIEKCYEVLGIIHKQWRPVPGRIKDYIATPKRNMYQSLHTTVVTDFGQFFEIQIRTVEMHKMAEYGIAAHWKYKMNDGGGSLRQGDEDKFAWVRRLLESQQESDAQDFFHNLKIDMFADEVFVFSPKGDVINLPAGATPIDFAYSIHSDVGNHMVGAKVNGRIVNFDYSLQNGDIVEIRTSQSSGPSRDWLNIARSGSARTKIKQWFKRERRDENIIRGRDMLFDELRHMGISPDDALDEAISAPVIKRLSYTSVDDMYAAIGYGGCTVSRVANRLRDELRNHESEKKSVLDKVNDAAERRNQNAIKEGKAVHGILVQGLENCLVKFSRCCTPVPGDDIIGFITRGQGVSIHRKDCPNYLNRLSDPESQGRWINVAWASQINDSYVTTISISSKDRSGLVMDIATVLNTLNAKVRNLSSRDIGGGLALTVLTLEVKSAEELRYIMSKLNAIPGVSQVTRNGI